jgi:SAM-dependent methyltransferase
LHTWSRGWEYTFIATALRRCLTANRDLVVLDVGSGVTFIDWLIAYDLLSASPRSRVLALDSNPSYQPWFDQINNRQTLKARNDEYPIRYAIPKVQFVHHDLQKKLPISNSTIDIVVCISVMEHVPDTVSAIRHIFGTLVKGGYLIITFDIDLTGAIVQHKPDKADQLLKELRQLGQEVEYDNVDLSTVKYTSFPRNTESISNLYTLDIGFKKGLDQSPWIQSKSEAQRRGLFISCPIFLKL